ncbi:hypothetical protein OQA88_1146 [Cercophora sp. LCS_1]
MRQIHDAGDKRGPRRRKPVPKNSTPNTDRRVPVPRQATTNATPNQQRKAVLEEQYRRQLEDIQRIFAALQDGEQQRLAAEKIRQLEHDYNAAKQEIIRLRELLALEQTRARAAHDKRERPPHAVRTQPIETATRNQIAGLENKLLHLEQEMKRRTLLERERYAKLSQGINTDTLTPVIAEDRHRQVLEAYDTFRRTRDWDVVREHFPELWELHIRFKSWEDARRAVPAEIANKERSKVIHLRFDRAGRFVATSTFYDTGNRLGRLLSVRKLRELGCSLDHVDRSKRVKFRGATGEAGYTLGSITLERDGSSMFPERRDISFHVWEDPVGLGDVLFGADEDSGLEPGDDGVPVLLPIKPVEKESHDERAEGDEYELLLYGSGRPERAPPPQQKPTGGDGCSCCIVM